MTKENRNRSFGEVIRERRRQLDLTQEEVARRVKTSIPFIGHLEANKRRPSDATVTKLADALSLDRSKLFFLANPAAKALLQQRKAQSGSTWEDFRRDQRLHAAHGVTEEEMDMLCRIALMGEVRSVRDFIYVLNTVRQALK